MDYQRRYRKQPAMRSHNKTDEESFGMSNETYLSFIKCVKSGTRWSSFQKLKERAQFPYQVHNYLGFECGISSMVNFFRIEVPELILAGQRSGEYRDKTAERAIQVWLTGRHEVFGIANPPELFSKTQQLIQTAPEGASMKEETMDNQVNADRNEMIALLQGANGMQFVKVVMNHSRLADEGVNDLADDAPKGKSGPALTYKALDLNLSNGDVVLVQYRERFGIGRVVKVYEEAPTSNEYDYRQPLRHAVQKVDVARSAQLEALDEGMLKKITASEAQDRLERLTRQLGMSVGDFKMELPRIGGGE